MDIKISGITGQIMREALEQARRGRMFILDKMEQALPEARTSTSKFAPRIHTLQIPVDKIRDLIGPGGKVIRGIVEQTGVKIDVEDSGKVNVASNDEAAMSRALQIIGDITATPEIGKTYLGKVVRLADFGAFVEIFPGTDGLLHISEIAEHRIKDVRDELHEGDQILVKVLALEGNRIKLSRKAILREQRAKMAGQGGGEMSGDGAPSTNGPTSPMGSDMGSEEGSITIEGGADFTEDENEPNFNREGEPAHAGAGDRPSGGRPQGSRPPGGGRGRRHHGGRRGPGGGGGDRGNRGGGGGGGGRR
jgi:polyribonucleotide nucleotidyltransferase